MKKLGTYSKTSWLLVIVFLALTSNVHAQDLFREMNRLKSEVSSLKTQVSDLKQMVLELRKAMLQSTLAPGHQGTPQAASKTSEKKAPPVSEEQITKTACQAVGRFFAEAEAALRAGNSSAATSQMRAALKKLNSALAEYDRTHRVSKLLRIYEGLSWDTYTAVQLRGSVAGNQDFLKLLQRHKQKYLETCPEKYRY